MEEITYLADRKVQFVLFGSFQREYLAWNEAAPISGGRTGRWSHSYSILFVAG